MFKFKPTRSPQAYLLRTLGFVAAGAMLLILGALTALAPELVVRLTPLILVGVVMLSAGFVTKTTVDQRLLRLWLAAIVVTITLWPSYMAIRVGGLPSIDLRKIVFGLSVLMFFYQCMARPVLSRGWQTLAPGAKWMCWAVALYGLLRFVSAFESQAPVLSFLAVAWEWVYYYIPFFFVLFLMRDEGSRQLFVRFVCLLSLAVLAFAVYERISGTNPLLRFAPVSNDAGELATALTMSRLRDGVFRAQATFEHPLMLAEFAAVVAAFSFGLALNGRLALVRLAGFAVFLASCAAALLSGSRIAFVSLAVVVAAVTLATVVRARGTRKITTAIATRLFVMLSMAAFAAMAVPLLQNLLLGRTATEASSSSARVQMLKDGIPAMLDSPFFGKGFGRAALEAGVYGSGGILTLDNYLLNVGIDAGVPALLIFIAIFILPAWMAFKRITEEEGPEQPFLIAGMAALIGLLAVRLILSIPYNLVFAFVIAALVVGAIPRKQLSHAPYGR
ncbi:O-antigen ligase family protein [Roseateles sp. BYS78W]|uniref:O-antigen ligase family protein n=1 Tax=Pelomonas candidula TaxID=3299025 RepID=A0ABW7HCG2_9BURK